MSPLIVQHTVFYAIEIQCLVPETTTDRKKERMKWERRNKNRLVETESELVSDLFECKTCLKIHLCMLNFSSPKIVCQTKKSSMSKIQVRPMSNNSGGSVLNSVPKAYPAPQTYKFR